MLNVHVYNLLWKSQSNGQQEVTSSPVHSGGRKMFEGQGEVRVGAPHPTPEDIAFHLHETWFVHSGGVLEGRGDMITCSPH